MRDDDEVSIKIEYYDTEEIDPLQSEPKDVFLAQEQLKSRGSESCHESISAVADTNCFKDSNNGSIVAEVDLMEPTWHRSINETGKYTCKFCALTYVTVQTLRRHILHKHKLEGCKLKKAMVKNKQRRKFRCHICTSVFTQFQNLTEHVKLIHKQEDLKCQCHICQAMFDNEELMYAHLSDKHKMNYKKLYICNICGYKTVKVSHYNQHQATHSADKNNKCQYCDYATSHLPNLRIHERIHLDSKPYTCHYDNCGYSASARSALRSHLLKHNPEENMLYCAKCPYKTVYKQSLKKHCDSHDRNTAKVVL